MSIVMAESIPTESIGAFRKPAIPTAKEINEAHKLAVSSAEGAVDSAIKCGQLLRAKMDELQHGERQEWIEKNCSFSHSTAKLYMSAAKQNAKGVAFSSLRHLYPSGKAPKVSSIETTAHVQTANALAELESAGDRENAVLMESPDVLAMTRRDLELVYEWRNECELMGQYTQEINAALGRVLTVAEIWLSRAS